MTSTQYDTIHEAAALVGKALAADGEPADGDLVELAAKRFREELDFWSGNSSTIPGSLECPRCGESYDEDYAHEQQAIEEFGKCTDCLGGCPYCKEETT